jgi:hypothetical protein
MVATFTPYSTGAALFGAKPSWITNDLDIQRIQSYQLYEEIYWTVSDVFKASFRGTNDRAVYIPSARTIIEATNRFTAPKFGLTFMDIPSGTTTGGQAPAAALAIGQFMARERFRSKFGGSKRYGLIRGDWIWHVTGNPAKPQGSRVSITSLDPAMYFPIAADDDVDRVIGCHLVEQLVTTDGPRVKRITYRKVLDANGEPTGTITVEAGLFKLDKWETLDAKPEVVLTAVTALPAQITAIPVYHIKNFEEPGNPFGSSEIRGFEVIMGAVNQTVSDEDLALAMDGIGMYATDAPSPTDSNGNDVPWQLGPGRVVHHPEGTRWDRVTGIGSTTPYGDHYDRLKAAMYTASGTPDIAIGKVDVKVASSGVALALELAPAVTKAAEKNDIILDVHNQLFFDLINGWYPAYEQTTFLNVGVTCTVGDAVPVDRVQRATELNDMLDRKVIDAEYYRSEMSKLGYVFPDDIQARIDASAQKDAATQATAFGVGGGAPVDNAPA